MHEYMDNLEAKKMAQESGINITTNILLGHFAHAK